MIDPALIVRIHSLESMEDLHAVITEANKRLSHLKGTATITPSTVDVTAKVTAYNVTPDVTRVVLNYSKANSKFSGAHGTVKRLTKNPQKLCVTFDDPSVGVRICPVSMLTFEEA